MGTTPTETHAWRALQAHHATIKQVHLRELFAEEPGRAERFAVEGAGLFLDYSKNRITGDTIQLLLALAEERRHHDDQRPHPAVPEAAVAALSGAPRESSHGVQRGAKCNWQ